MLCSGPSSLNLLSSHVPSVRHVCWDSTRIHTSPDLSINQHDLHLISFVLPRQNVSARCLGSQLFLHSSKKLLIFFPPFPSFLLHPQRDNLSPSFLILSVSEGCVWVCLQFWFMSTVLIFCSVSGVFRILPFCNKMEITLWDSFSYIHRLCQGCYY